MEDHVARTIERDVRALCDPGDRDLGTPRNRAATAYVAGRLATAAAETGTIRFEVPEWRPGRASVTATDAVLALHPGPFSPAVDGAGPLVPVARADELAASIPRDAVLLILGEAAATQLTPRGYPFYSDPGHAAILDAMEALRPLAVLAATGTSPMTGGMSPFPLIEEVGFSAASAYMTPEQGARLARSAGERVSVSIESEVRPSHGLQPWGRSPGRSGRRIVVSAHVDSKPGTPGALDNAAGVAVMLAVADLLRGADPSHTVEFVPFNGEDHVLAPGEVAWLGANDSLADVLIAINVDAPGLPGMPSAYSAYGVDDAAATVLAGVAARHADVAEGPPWPASDHMIFAMRGVPAIAITSGDFARAAGVYSHTPKDVPAVLDYDLLAGTARFVADLIGQVPGPGPAPPARP